MKKWIAGAVLIILVALAFNPDFLLSEPEGYAFAFHEDHSNVMAGYWKVHSFTDTLIWWHGFIGELHQALRPIACYLFYAQNWLGLHYGYQVTYWTAFALFALDCLLIAALTFRITRSFGLALFAGVLSTHVSAMLPTLTTKYGGLPFTWFYISDNTLVAAFMLWAMIAFLLWRESGQRKYLAASYFAVICGCLTKEQAYITGLLIFILCFVSLPAVKTERAAAMLHSFLMACIAAICYALRAVLIPNAHTPPHRLESLREVLHNITPASPLEMILIWDGWRAFYGLSCYGLVFGGLYLIWRNRDALRADTGQRRVFVALSNAALMFLIAEASLIPALGFDVAGHRGMLAVMLKAASVTALMHALLIAHEVVEVPHFARRKAPIPDSGRGNSTTEVAISAGQ